MAKNTAGKGYESGRLCILDAQVSKPITCSITLNPLEAHCWLCHPSLPLLKQSCPQFSDVSNLDCESCQCAKHLRLSGSPTVNKQASSSFKVVCSDVWGPCLIVSKFMFRYFAIFIDSYSHIIWLYYLALSNEKSFWVVLLFYCICCWNQNTLQCFYAFPVMMSRNTCLIPFKLTWPRMGFSTKALVLTNLLRME